MDAGQLMEQLTAVRETLQAGMIKARREVDEKARRIVKYVEGLDVETEVQDRFPLL